MQDLLLDGVAGRLLEVHFGQAAGSRHHGGDVGGGDPLAGLLADEREGPADARGCADAGNRSMERARGGLGVCAALYGLGRAMTVPAAWTFLLSKDGTEVTFGYARGTLLLFR